MAGVLRSPLVWAGLSVWAVSTAIWVIVWFIDARMAAAMGATFVAFFFGGKLAAVPTGLSLGVPSFLVAAIVVVPDSGAVLATYPLLQKGWTHAGRWSYALEDLRRRGENPDARHRRIVERFGAWGVLLLTITPVGFVSALVVAAIGQMMGLAPRRVIVPVIAGQAIMAVVLVLLFGAGLGAVAMIHPALPFAMTGVLVAVLLGREGFLRVKRRRMRKAKRKAARASGSP